MKAKKILCYGDSNTWGCRPADSTRFGRRVRWPMVMASALGKGYSVIEDAENGRTVLKLNDTPSLNGVAWIESKIESYVPLYAAIICLGINDIFVLKEIQLPRVVKGIEKIVDIIKHAHTVQGIPFPNIILLTPVMPSARPEEMNFYQLEINKAAALIAEYPLIARNTGSRCLDISDSIHASEKDGSHMEDYSHKKLGRIAADFIKRIDDED